MLEIDFCDVFSISHFQNFSSFFSFERFFILIFHFRHYESYDSRLISLENVDFNFWRLLIFTFLKNDLRNLIDFYILNDCYNIFWWTFSFAASLMISIEYEKINNNYEQISTMTSWIVWTKKRISMILTTKSSFCFSITSTIFVTWKLKNKTLSLWFAFLTNLFFSLFSFAIQNEKNSKEICLSKLLQSIVLISLFEYFNWS